MQHVGRFEQIESSTPVDTTSYHGRTRPKYDLARKIFLQLSFVVQTRTVSETSRSWRNDRHKKHGERMLGRRSRFLFA